MCGGERGQDVAAGVFVRVYGFIGRFMAAAEEEKLECEDAVGPQSAFVAWHPQS